MAITTQGYDGVAHEIDEVGWAHISDSYGSAYSVAGLDGAPDENAGRVTTVSSADRTVAVAPLIAYGHGVRDRSDSTVNVQLPSVTAGLARWFLVAVRRDWQANTTTIAALPDAQTTAVIPPQRETTRGVKDDQPLALVQITGGQSIPTQVIDLRCWSGNGGVVAATTNALAYLSDLGSRITVGETLWERTLNAQGTPVWLTRTPPMTDKPYIFGNLRRSDGAMVVNNGNTDLKFYVSGSSGSGWTTAWQGVGISHPLAGQWWVQATVATSIAGARYAELNVKALASGSTGMLGPTSVDVATGGFGRVTLEGVVVTTGPLGLSLSLTNTGVGGTIRSGVLRAVWMGPA